MIGESGIDALVRFARLASEARSASTILPILAKALVVQVGADAVAIVEIQESGAKLVASPYLPRELDGIALDQDAIGEELGRQFLAACHGRFSEMRTRPLVSGGGLFGSVVMFFAEGHKADLHVADGLVDLAAISLSDAAQLAALARSHAELKASQDALLRTEKLRALGQMAAGVSHDLKNILSPLSLHLQFVDRAIERAKLPEEKKAELKKSIVDMKGVVTRGVQTVERLRDYSRQSHEERAEAIQLDRLVHEAAEIARPRMAGRVGALSRIHEKLSSPPTVLGRSGEIVSALVNIVVNAIDAMASGGNITLRTGESEGSSWVSVSDDGPGMPPEVERRVFDPFFTTKGDEGTGLGLAMVFACMQRHGGSVSVETALGRGTTFTLSFPQGVKD